jgi:NAD(P)-dependent dehydrogenase (short-subunit alcohol dehydrogenase family)
MDPAQFGTSTLPMQHAPYGPILPDALQGVNSGKVALVTGAGQGIGAAIAESLAKSGASVAILDLSADKLIQTKETCLAFGGKVEAFGCDVTDQARVTEVLEEVVKRLGPLDVLVNNAGIFDQRPFLMSTFDGFWKQIEVNFKAVSHFSFFFFVLLSLWFLPKVLFEIRGEREREKNTNYK